MRAAEADRARVLHMLDAIRQLEANPSCASAQALDDDPMLRFGTVKLIEIIGEAANMLTKELRERHADISWPLIIGMRHRLVHDYFRIDTTIVAEVVANHIPILRGQLEAVIADLPE
ncbi:MAG TPA: DUF86 domain-containing protein [Flavobacteriales bacterium]|nr:DUF86 domain-containing protein [Flavobacteriales bacterium]